MAEDQTNPFTLMGLMGLMSPNKYLNPMYKDKPLPMPGYYGEPTAASGQKIQSYQDAKTAHDQWAAANPAQGTTLNSTALKPGGIWGNAPEGGYGLTEGQPYSMSQLAQKMGVPDQGSTGANDAAALSMMMGVTPTSEMGFNQQPQQAAAPAASKNPVDMRQAYLDALSDPQGGKPMPVQGATVPASAPLGQPSVMDAFLSAHPQGGATTGSYSNKPFFDTLNQLRSA